MSTQTVPMTTGARTKKEGDIGSVFASFSGSTTLPQEFARFKREIVSSPELEESIKASWARLLTRLESVTADIETHGTEVSFAQRQRLN